jgi:hypothetical protein
MEEMSCKGGWAQLSLPYQVMTLSQSSKNFLGRLK